MKSTIRNSKNTGANKGNYPSGYDIEEVRAEADHLLKTLKSRSKLSARLSVFDSYYDTVTGYNELWNVRKCRAGLAATQRAIHALKKMIGQNKNSQKTLTKHGLKL